jgi:hypothetical protein
MLPLTEPISATHVEKIRILRHAVRETPENEARDQAARTAAFAIFSKVRITLSFDTLLSIIRKPCS